jgi:hexosaminidase
MHKLNSFHWHLTDDQGWRIEIKKYPKLTEVGAWRKDSMLVYSPEKYTGEPHGGFYTQDDIREVVAYAAKNHINVVPEIEMPGHAQAAIAAYPELGNLGEPLDVGVKWGVYENVFNVEDKTIQFLQDVLDEVMALFPGAFIHIGGDECPKKQWKDSPFAQAKMKKLGMPDEHALQSWFVGQMDDYIASKGRRLIGWSEILEGGLAPGAALMVWLGNEGAEQAVASGHDVVMAQTTHTYFDYYQVKDTSKEPHGIGGFLPIEQVYQYEPILPSFTPEQAKHVLGAQFQIWAEYIPNGRHAEYMAFPRACALSEVVWSPKEARNWEDFSSRLPANLERLRALDVNFYGAVKAH